MAIVTADVDVRRAWNPETSLPTREARRASWSRNEARLRRRNGRGDLAVLSVEGSFLVVEEEGGCCWRKGGLMMMVSGDDEDVATAVREHNAHTTQ
jgi:hypothetical protein